MLFDFECLHQLKTGTCLEEVWKMEEDSSANCTGNLSSNQIARLSFLSSISLRIVILFTRVLSNFTGNFSSNPG